MNGVSLLLAEGVKEFSVSMAIVDFIPVICFAVAAVILQRDLYYKMSKGMFALFAGGTINVVIAGALKALYKLLYALGICDFEALSNLFMPLQAIGFLLAGLAMLSLTFRGEKKNASMLALAPAPFSGTFVFIGAMVAGLLGVVIGLSKLAIKRKQYFAFALFVLSFICSMCMGYLSSRDFTQAIFNWIAEGVNVVGQATMLIGAIQLHNAMAKEGAQ